jgi:putative ABC transport system permease protein
MIKHLFKLIWNKKRQNFLMITEMFVSFLVVFSVLSLLVFYYHNYKKPVGFDYDNVWVVSYSMPENIRKPDSVVLFRETLKRILHSMPQVKNESFTGANVPFSMSQSNSDISYGKQRTMTNIYEVDNDYAPVLKLDVQRGRWFTNSDDAAGVPPVVINEKLKQKLFGTEEAVGKIIGIDAGKLRVIGVVSDMKDKGSYQPVEEGMYRKPDTGSLRYSSTILLKVAPGTDAAFEGRLFKELSNAIGRSIEIEHLDKKLVSKNRIFIVPAIIFAIVAGFIIFNVALGLFGVLWYNINKRRGEIGLRRAIGATGRSVSAQLVAEALILATFSILLGLFFAIQFPLLNVLDLPAGIYVEAIAIAVIFIYTLVLICALYPGKQAAAIYPAVALHEN